MQRQELWSGNLRSVGYDPTAWVLEIEFARGSIYQYYGVPPTVYNRFLEARSYGVYFARHIRNVYRYRRVPAMSSLFEPDEEPEVEYET